MTTTNFSLILLALYFLPGIIASARHHHNRTAISVLNLLLGWTILGWIGAMVWACTFVAPFVAPSVAPSHQPDPRWANLRATTSNEYLSAPPPLMTRRHRNGGLGTATSNNSFYVAMTVWAVCLLVVGVALVLKGA